VGKDLLGQVRRLPVVLVELVRLAQVG